MKVKVQAQLLTVQAKPPKEVGDEPTMKLVFEVQGTQQIGNLARYLGQIVSVEVESAQLHFDDVAPSRETRMAQTG